MYSEFYILKAQNKYVKQTDVLPYFIPVTKLTKTKNKINIHVNKLSITKLCNKTSLNNR